MKKTLLVLLIAPMMAFCQDYAYIENVYVDRCKCDNSPNDTAWIDIEFQQGYKVKQNDLLLYRLYKSGSNTPVFEVTMNVSDKLPFKTSKSWYFVMPSNLDRWTYDIYLNGKINQGEIFISKPLSFEDNIEQAQAKEIAYYDIEGRQTQERTGLLIVLYSDGTRRKVFFN